MKKRMVSILLALALWVLPVSAAADSEPATQTAPPVAEETSGGSPVREEEPAQAADSAEPEPAPEDSAPADAPEPEDPESPAPAGAPEPEEAEPAPENAVSLLSAETAALMEAAPPSIPTDGDKWDGTTLTRPTKLTKKDGVNYYEITTCAELAYVAQTGGEWLGRNYLLANDLILNDVVLTWDKDGSLTTDPAKLHQWTPIGEDYKNGFTGKFDGSGHSVSGVYINQPEKIYIGFFGDTAIGAEIRNLTVVNSHVTGRYYVGGIAGDGSGSITNCVNYGAVTGSGDDAGGIAGSGYGSITNCVNYGAVTGSGYNVGGIVGSRNGSITNCVNYGAVTGSSEVGGIAGLCDFHDTYNCVNYGAVTGQTNVGGIAGDTYSGRTIENSYNTATITGESNVGGIIGGTNNSRVTNCYNIGSVVCTVSGNNAGAVTGSDGAVWGKDTITGCYYLKTASVNPSLCGCGGVSSADMEPDGFYARSEADMKTRSTYEGWDFGEIWRVNEKYNRGYPYLAWEHADDAPPLSGITLSAESVTISKGDTCFLTASPVPSDAAAFDLKWTSGNSSVASVNSYGQITGVGAGTTTITASGGGFTASCAVEVTPRAADEYQLNGITVRDSAGAPLTGIPRGSFLATVSVTKTQSFGNTEICLAAYSRAGQFRGLFYAAAEDIPAGSTFRFTFPVDNTGGAIAELRAFAVSSLSDLRPLGAAVRFGGE